MLVDIHPNSLTFGVLLPTKHDFMHDKLKR